jgi:hypothetical protein
MNYCLTKCIKFVRQQDIILAQVLNSSLGKDDDVDRRTDSLSALSTWKVENQVYPPH